MCADGTPLAEEGRMGPLPPLRRLARVAAIGAVVSTAIACGPAESDDTANSASESLVQLHIQPGVERARQAAKAGAPTADVQRASVHFGNAYWLARLSFLSYSNQADVKTELTKAGFDVSHVHFFENTCTGAFAFYLTGDGYSVLTFRGTEPTWNDWATDLDSWKTGWKGSGFVHTGFLSRFNSIWSADRACGVDEGVGSWLASHHTGGDLYLTGHSMGAALATLALATTQADACGQDSKCTRPPSMPVSALYTFGSPKVGNQDFAHATARMAKGRTPIYRFVNGDDPVTIIPRDLNPTEALLFTDYRHVSNDGEGEEVFQVWMRDKTLEVATWVPHISWNPKDHLSYPAPILFQAHEWNQYH